MTPVTLQKYAQSGRVPCTTPGGHVDEVSQALGARSLDVVQVVVQEWASCLPAHLEPVWLGVFGSVARGQDLSSSDVDLLVVRSPRVRLWGRAWGRAKADLMAALSNALDGRGVDLLDIGADELEKFLQGSPDLAKSLDRDLVRVALGTTR